MPTTPLKRFNSRHAKKIIFVIALALWFLFLWRAIDVFKPGVASLHYYNSDCAIPVLMSHEERPLTPFNLYYYGTDRWGAWPFLIAQAVSRVTGFRWSDISLSTFQITWIFIGALAIAAFSRGDYPVIGAIFLLTLCLHGETRYQIFWLSQVYGWQLTALLLSWLCLRKLISGWVASDSPRARLWPAWLALTFFFSYLAIWSSGGSVLFLLLLAAVEIARVRFQNGEVKLTARGWFTATGTAFGAVVAAAALERGQRFVYHSYALKHYGSDFSASSHLRLDFGNLNHNLATQLSKLINLAWWPLELVATVALVIALSIIVYGIVNKKGSLNRSFKPLLSEELFWLILGAAGIAAINFILTVLIAHVRINQYEDRYLTITAILGPVSGLLALYLVIKMSMRRTRKAKLVMPIATAAAILLLVVRFPAPGFRHEYQTYRDIAAGLEKESPRGILLGDYWGTYVFTSLQHARPLTPVPVEGQENRMPWTREIVRQATQVIVEYKHSKLAENGPPPARLTQYGNTFRLVDADWYQSSAFAFALYQQDNAGER